MPLSVRYYLTWIPTAASSISNWSFSCTVSVPVRLTWWTTKILPLEASQNMVPPRYFWVDTSFPWADNWRPSRRDLYWSENTRYPGWSLFCLRMPLEGDFMVFNPFFGVRCCLPSWHAAHFGGYTVANPLCVLESYMSPLGMSREKSFLVGRQVMVRVVGETRKGQWFGGFHCVIETSKYG